MRALPNHQLLFLLFYFTRYTIYYITNLLKMMLHTPEHYRLRVKSYFFAVASFLHPKYHFPENRKGIRQNSVNLIVFPGVRRIRTKKIPKMLFFQKMIS